MSRRVSLLLLISFVLWLFSVPGWGHFTINRRVENLNIDLSVAAVHAAEHDEEEDAEVRAGENQFLLIVLDISQNYRPVDEAHVQLRFRMLDHEMGEQVVNTQPQGYGTYAARGSFSLPGRWLVIAEIRLPGRPEPLRAEFDLDVQAPVHAPAVSKRPFGLSKNVTLTLIVGSFLLALGAWLFFALLWLRSRRQYKGVLIALALGGIAWLALGAYLTIQWLTLPAPKEAPEIEAGQRLYAQHCASCHGGSGRGDGPQAQHLPIRPADLTQHLDHHGDSALARMILEGIPPFMPPTPLSEEETLQLLRFLRTLAADHDQ